MKEIERLKFLIFRTKIDINSSYGRISQDEIEFMIDELNKWKRQLKIKEKKLLLEKKLKRILKMKEF